jgi:protein-L-isoaspartate O-methyltransferase
VTVVDELNTWIDHAQRLAAELVAAGVITDPAWRQAVEAVPRHVFLPEFWAHTGEEDEPPRGRRYTSQTPGYLDVAYSDDTLVTQYIERDGFPWATSSSTAPSLMLRMLHDLDVSDEMTVLEIGTGTGYNAALLSQRLSDRSVTSIDIDPGLIHLAHQRLKEAGCRPVVAARDGRDGYPDRSPYDRLIATVSFDRLPPQWISQVRPGGIVLADLRPVNATLTGALAKLTVQDDGTARGPLLPCRAGFMSGRPDAVTPCVPSAPPIDKTTVHVRESTVGGQAVEQDGLSLIIWRHLPTLGVYQYADIVMVVLSDGSWAEVPRTDQDQTVRFEYGGPTDVWAVVESAATWWTRHGMPGVERFGLTANPAGEQMWLDDPRQPIG